MNFFRPVIIPALLFTIAGVGCSSNDSNDEVLIDDPTAGSPSDNPYQDPDPDGMTAIARAGYARVRDSANALVSGSYLDGLLSVEDFINTNFVLFEEFENRQFDCPETGNVLVTQSGFAGPQSTMQFANCGINGVELNGPLVHVRGGGAIGAGSYTTVDWEFNALEITESNRAVTVTGTASRYTSTTGSMGAGCAGERDSNIAVSFTVNTNSAAIIDALNTINVTDNQYEQYMQDTFIGPVGEPEGPCSPLRYVGFSGTANILSTEFGPETAQVQKSGVSVLEGNPDEDLLAGGTISGPAMLSVDFNDGSTLDITQPTEIEGESLVTITSEGVTSTFNDESFRFEF